MLSWWRRKLHFTPVQIGVGCGLPPPCGSFPRVCETGANRLESPPASNVSQGGSGFDGSWGGTRKSATRPSRKPRLPLRAEFFLPGCYSNAGRQRKAAAGWGVSQKSGSSTPETDRPLLFLCAQVSLGGYCRRGTDFDLLVFLLVLFEFDRKKHSIHAACGSIFDPRQRKACGARLPWRRMHQYIPPFMASKCPLLLGHEDALHGPIEQAGSAAPAALYNDL